MAEMATATGPVLFNGASPANVPVPQMLNAVQQPRANNGPQANTQQMTRERFQMLMQVNITLAFH